MAGSDRIKLRDYRRKPKGRIINPPRNIGSFIFKENNHCFSNQAIASSGVVKVFTVNPCEL